jgi:hypothetical protein
MGKAFATAHQRIAWAKQDIRDLKEKAREFFSSDIHKRIVEPDSDGYMVDKVRFTKRLPSNVTKSAVSAIENLRAALDHTACSVVPFCHKTKTAFPFGDSKGEFEGHLKSKGKHLPDEIKSLFRAFKPYQRGNPPLWALNKLCNTHKHRTIIEPGIDVKDVEFVSAPFASFLRYHRPKWDRRKNEIIISRTTGNGTSQHDVDLLLGIQFGKVQVFSGLEALSSLRSLTSMVERIVMATEAEAKRIGVTK